MSGLALQLERDLEIGDWISLDDSISGRIREVRWRATTIVTKNGDLMLIPNSAITRATIVELTAGRPPRTASGSTCGSTFATRRHGCAR